MYTLYINRKLVTSSSDSWDLVTRAKRAYAAGASHAAVYRGSDLVIELDD